MIFGTTNAHYMGVVFQDYSWIQDFKAGKSALKSEIQEYRKSAAVSILN